jgi:hypothetical protein
MMRRRPGRRAATCAAACTQNPLSVQSNAYLFVLFAARELPGPSCRAQLGPALLLRGGAGSTTQLAALLAPLLASLSRCLSARSAAASAAAAATSASPSAACWSPRRPRASALRSSGRCSTQRCVPKPKASSTSALALRYLY